MSVKQEKSVSSALDAESESTGVSGIEKKCMKIESETAIKTAVASSACSNRPNNCIRIELPDATDTVVVCKNGRDS